MNRDAVVYAHVGLFKQDVQLAVQNQIGIGKGVRCEAEYEERLVQAGCGSILDRYESLRLCGSTAVY